MNRSDVAAGEDADRDWRIQQEIRTVFREQILGETIDAISATVSRVPGSLKEV